MIARVEALLREVAEELVMPRFRKLAAHEVMEKSPGDVVTIVDRETEAALTTRLTDFLQGSLVVGEEAVSADHRLLERIGDPGPVWVVDPIDGTSNFVAGREPFALMVGLLRGGRPVLGVIYEPVAGTVAAAELGSGSYLDGQRITVDSSPVSGPSGLVASLSVKYLPEELRAQVVERSKALGQIMPPQHCAGREYPDVVTGRRDFSLMWRTLPWDHVPGALFATEAGGVVRHFDAAPYDPVQPKAGLLICRNEEVFHVARSALLE